jgi:spore maturation protein CgeB
MRILYVAMKYDYGEQSRGYGFEHYNFFDALHHMGHDLLYFDFASLLQQRGHAAMNRRLREVVRTEKPDLLFCVLFRDELDRRIMRGISESGDTVTVNWFCDDHWRFDGFSRHWAPCFNRVVTTAASALPRYAQCGFHHVINSQWACNHYLYRKLDLPLAYDITFVGRPHGNRRAIITALRDAGIQVQTFGPGWENGRVDQEQMIAIFNQSRINLNLANASTVPRQEDTGMRAVAKRAAKKN